MKIKKLDELQYIKRGNVFGHCLITLIGLLVVNIIMIELGIVFMNQRNMLIFIIIFTVSQFCIEMICYDIFPLSEKRQRFVYIFAGLIGIVFIFISVHSIISGEAGFTENEILSDAGAGIFTGCLMLSIFLSYTIKYLYKKRTGDSNEN